MLRIGDDRSDSDREYEPEFDTDEAEDEGSPQPSGSHISNHSARNPPRTSVRRIVRRSRTRYTNGSTTMPAYASSGGSDGSFETIASGSVPPRPSAGRAPHPPAKSKLRFTNGALPFPSYPIWRLTSLPDPTSVALELLDCWAIVIPPPASPHIMGFLRRNSGKLGRGKTIGTEDDPLRHAKTLTKKADDNGSLRALLCLESALDENGLRQLVQTSQLPLEEIRLLRQQVASTPAPIKERAAEWSAAWPVAMRVMGGPVASSSSGTSTPGASGNAPPQSPSAIAASLIGSSSPRSAPFVDRKADCAYWSAARTNWVVRKLARCVLLAEDASRRGEVPIGVHVCPSILSTSTTVNAGSGLLGEGSQAVASTQAAGIPATFGGWDIDGVPLEGGEAIEVDAFDTRISQRNPIKHAVGNAIRKVAELRAYKRAPAASISSHFSDRVRVSSPITPLAAAHPHGDNMTPSRSSNAPFSSSGTSGSSPGQADAEALEQARPSSPSGSASSQTSMTSPSASLATLLNGQDYLLTSLTLFTTHEPCVYCCMSLVHSRVRNVIFLEASPGSGGCCGSLLPKGKRCDQGIDVAEGGPYALQEQRGLNHRYEVWKWRGGLDEIREEVARQRIQRATAATLVGQQPTPSSPIAEQNLDQLLDLSRWGALDP